MCGRIVRTSPRVVIADELGVTQFVNVDFAARYNIAPSQAVETIVRNGDALRCGLMKWGFVASDKATSAPINARAETAATARPFAEAFRRRRCWVVADGFYEWQKEGRTKRPYFIHLRSGRPFALAGIWAVQHTATGTRVPTCAILTCQPNALMAPIHNRMPVILAAATREHWLDNSRSVAELNTLLVPLPAEEMEAYEVSSYVNSPRNDSLECIRRVEP